MVTLASGHKCHLFAHKRSLAQWLSKSWSWHKTKAALSITLWSATIVANKPCCITQGAPSSVPLWLGSLYARCDAWAEGKGRHFLLHWKALPLPPLHACASMVSHSLWWDKCAGGKGRHLQWSKLGLDPALLIRGWIWHLEKQHLLSYYKTLSPFLPRRGGNTCMPLWANGEIDHKLEPSNIWLQDYLCSVHLNVMNHMSS